MLKWRRKSVSAFWYPLGISLHCTNRSNGVDENAIQFVYAGVLFVSPGENKMFHEMKIIVIVLAQMLHGFCLDFWTTPS